MSKIYFDIVGGMELSVEPGAVKLNGNSVVAKLSAARTFDASLET